jgi:hypothetical protein
MIRFNYLIPFAIVLLLIVSAGCLQEHPAPIGVNNTTPIRHANMQTSLHEMTGSIQYNLDAFNSSIDDVAASLGETGLSGLKADTLVEDLASCHPAILSAITVDTNGTVLSAAPDNAKILIGQNIAYQEAISLVLSTRQPAMSKYFTLRQGGEGVAIVSPVFSPRGEFLGALSMAFSPSLLVTPFAEESKTRAPFTYIVTQPDGVILYHSNPILVGKQAFDEPFFERFPEILDLVNRCITERTGYTTFLFYKDDSEEIVPKETFWDTVALHNNEWRVLVVAEKE